MVTSKKIDNDQGKRVRIAITVCGMKLPAFGKKYHISFSHLYAIEKGDRQLNEKTASKIADGIIQEGYFCTVKWLLTGEGAPPLKGEAGELDLDESDTILASLSPELKIVKEAAFFRKLYDNSVVSCLLDDGMEPTYFKGDYVGGCTVETIKDAIGKDCIITTKEGEQFTRRLLKGSKPELYTLVCTNPFTKESSPILFNCAILTAAPIIWHRRRHY